MTTAVRPAERNGRAPRFLDPQLDSIRAEKEPLSQFSRRGVTPETPLTAPGPQRSAVMRVKLSQPPLECAHTHIYGTRESALHATHAKH